MSARILAVTGGTGFVGRTLIALAPALGWQVRALARRPQAPQIGVTWISGALDQPASLAELVEGADAIVHLAGVVNAPNRAGFEAGNIAGTQAMVDAAQAGGVTRFIHVSSLSARLPELSNYGWSKARGEDSVAASSLNWTIVRPPAIFGPGDTEMLELFKMAQRGLVFTPPAGQLSVIHVADLVRLLLVLIHEGHTHAKIYEPDDGRDDWTHAGFAHALGVAFGKKVSVIGLPKSLMLLGAVCDRLIRRDRAKLTRDRVNYFCHPDWRVDPALRPLSDVWHPLIETPAGLQVTLEYYRAAKWIS